MAKKWVVKELGISEENGLQRSQPQQINLVI